jgi:hypothetical protein
MTGRIVATRSGAGNPSLPVPLERRIQLKCSIDIFNLIADMNCKSSLLLAPSIWWGFTTSVLAADDLATTAANAQMIGGIEAVVAACAPIDAKSGKTGSDLLENAAARRKLDLASIRKSDAYKSIYNSEVNRLLSLPLKDRQAACRSAW